MSMVNPFSNYMAWIIPIFIWIYISYYERSFISYFILIIGILLISLTRGSSEAMKTGRKYRSATHFIASIPISKWIWEVTLVPYSVVSIISIWSFNSEFLAYSLFWLAISGLAYNVVATIFFLSKNPNILKFFRAIGMLLGMIWKDRKKRS